LERRLNPRKKPCNINHRRNYGNTGKGNKGNKEKSKYRYIYKLKYFHFNQNFLNKSFDSKSPSDVMGQKVLQKLSI